MIRVPLHPWGQKPQINKFRSTRGEEPHTTPPHNSKALLGSEDPRDPRETPNGLPQGPQGGTPWPGPLTRNWTNQKSLGAPCCLFPGSTTNSDLIPPNREG